VIRVSNADRIVFPEIGTTKGEVVAYYERVAPRMLPHLEGRALSIRRYPKGLAGPGFFQKNVPAHYPPSIGRFAVPRSKEASKRHRDPGARERQETVYPVLRELEHVPYVANQGAIELHVPTARAESLFRPDRMVMDLDPPPGATALVRRAAHVVRDALGEHGLPTVPVATGSKGYHLVSVLSPTTDGDVLATALQQLAMLLVAAHPDSLTLAFRVASRGERVFVDWMRNHPLATVIAPYSLRAKPRATAAAPLAWDEIDALAPDAFSIADVDRLLDRPDTVATLAPADAAPFCTSVNAAFDRSGLVLETFDRFRS
jgi:bifunctional non-homologous end joining protein LigD